MPGGLNESQYCQALSLLVSDEGYVADNRWLPKAKEPQPREFWADFIDANLLELYDRAYITELNAIYSKRLNLRISFTHEFLVAWTLKHPPKPYKISMGSLILHRESDRRRNATRR